MQSLPVIKTYNNYKNKEVKAHLVERDYFNYVQNNLRNNGVITTWELGHLPNTFNIIEMKRG